MLRVFGTRLTSCCRAAEPWYSGSCTASVTEALETAATALPLQHRRYTPDPEGSSPNPLRAPFPILGFLRWVCSPIAATHCLQPFAACMTVMSSCGTPA